MTAYFLIGAIAGILSGLFGIGGGVVVVPALSFVFQYHNGYSASHAVHAAAATSLAVMIMTSLSSLYAHHRKNNVRWSVIRPMIIWLMIGSLLGAAIATQMPARAIRICFAVFLLYIGGRLLLSRQYKKQATFDVPPFILRVIGTGTGILSGILGIGGGALLSPFFLRAGLEMREAAGTSVLCGLTIGLTATLGFLFLGSVAHTGKYIDLTAFFSVALASMMAAPLGVKLVMYLPKTLSRRAFGIFLLIMAGYLFF
ncbi:MAG: sulfite exporter TauE/SafE family protein [Gammaproteobacteria bacterium]|nr:sulfite exporter TauE/SafE family protein [Gammaproteobacteria bacterium]